MVVPVVLGSCTFDYRPLRSEQSRLSKTLVLPSPRDKDDTSLVLEVEDDPAMTVNGSPPNPKRVPFKYPSFIKVRYDKEGDLPIFELWMKDNFDQEHKISKERTLTGPVPPNIGTSRITINDNPLTGLADPDGEVNDSFAVNPITGDIYRNAYWDATTKEIRDAGNLTPDQTGFAGDLLGTVKFDGVTGLALAAVNTRIADISNAVEGVTKVLSATISNIDAVLNVVR